MVNDYQSNRHDLPPLSATGSIICDAMGHAAERKEKREKDDPSRDSNHTPSTIRADFLSS